MKRKRMEKESKRGKSKMNRIKSGIKTRKFRLLYAPETIMLGKNGLPAFSVSAGVAFSLLGYDETVYHNADRALYTTKENNRSGCTIFEEMKK